jgi:hypothetical protein
MVAENPTVSVILIAPGHHASIAATLDCLQAQTIREQIELVLATTAREGLDLPTRLVEGFWGLQVVEVGPIHSSARARAAAVRVARAPVVAFAEDHARPAHDWAEALLNAHAGPRAAVGPSVGNGNPSSLLSWANLLIDYAPWLHPAPGGPAEHLPGHNGSYKRDVLLSLGARLEDLLEAETILHWQLRASGHELYIEPRARTDHLNYVRLADTIPLRFGVGRAFAAARSADWPRVRRLVYAASAPLIPPIRLRRTLAELQLPGRPRHLLPRVLPLLCVGLAIDAAGQLVGYAAGPGNSIHHNTQMEFDAERRIGRRRRSRGGV